MNENDRTQGSGNVFLDLGFEPGKSAVMLIRIEVTSHIVKRIGDAGWSPAAAAHQLGITQPQVAQILDGKIEQFSLDVLWMLAARAGVHLALTLVEPTGHSS